jgi:excisionase family DNA binding protein
MVSAFTRDEILALPPTVDVATASKALGISRTTGYTLAKNGDFPCRVIRAGRRYLIPTAEIHALLGLTGPPRQPRQPSSGSQDK